MESENEEFSFTSIGFQAALILNKLRLAAQLNLDEQQHEKREGDPNASHTDKPDSGTHREKVDHHLRELASLERRARGK